MEESKMTLDDFIKWYYDNPYLDINDLYEEDYQIMRRMYEEKYGPL